MRETYSVLSARRLQDLSRRAAKHVTYMWTSVNLTEAVCTFLQLFQTDSEMKSTAPEM
jgi:hypothetical protein